MANEKIFKIKIDGITRAYKDVVDLSEALTKIENKKIKIEAGLSPKDIANKIKNLINQVETLTKKNKELDRSVHDSEKGTEEQIVLFEEAKEAAQFMKDSIDSLQTAFSSLSEEEQTNSAKGESLMESIKELQEQYTELTSLIEEYTYCEEYNSELITEVSDKYEALSGKIKIGTSAVNQILEVLNDGTGLMQAFGVKTDFSKKAIEEISKALKIVNSIQALNNSLLAKGGLLSKEGAAIEAIRIIQMKAANKALALQTKGTVAATVAQGIFNVVAKANPYVLLAMAIISVVGALAFFASSTDDASDRQEKMNELVKESISLKNNYINHLKKCSQQIINQYQREYDLAVAQGESEEKLEKKRKKILDERLKLAQKIKNNSQKEIEQIDKNREAVSDLTGELNEYQKAYYNACREGKKKIEVNINGRKFIKSADEIEKKMKSLQTGLDIVQSRLDIGLSALEGEKEAENNIDKEEAENRKRRIENAKKDAIAMAEYKILIAKKGSEEELKANKEAINTRLNAEISGAEITNGERLKRKTEALQKIEKLEEDYRKSQLQNEIDLIDAHLAVTQKGSAAEYDFQVKRLYELKEFELINKKQTAEQKRLIEEKYLKDIDELNEKHDQIKAENEYEEKVANIKERLAEAEIASKEELSLKEEMLKLQAKHEIYNARISIENTELRAAKIKEIETKLQQDLKKLTEEGETSNLEKKFKKETLALTEQLRNKEITQSEFDSKMQQAEINYLEEQIAIKRKAGEDTTDLEIELSQKRIQQSKAEEEAKKKNLEKMIASMSEYADKIMSHVNSIFDATNDIINDQLNEAKEKYEEISKQYDDVVKKREESNNRLQELEEQASNARGGRALVLQQQVEAEMIKNQELAAQEKQLAKEKEKQEKEIAKKEKQQKKVEIAQNIAQAIVNTSLAVMKAYASSPLTLGMPWSGIIGAVGAIQVASMTKQLSKLEDGGLLKGKRHSQGGMRVEGTNIEVEGGEYVVNRESTNRNLGLIRYINSQRRELQPQDINAFFSRSQQIYEPPFRRMFEQGGQMPPVENVVNVDNESLVEAIRSIRIEPKVSVTDINAAQDKVVEVSAWSGM